MKYILTLISFVFAIGCSDNPPVKESIPSNHNAPIRKGEVQLIIEPEYDHYLFGETIWLKVTIHNNTEKDFYITYLPDNLSVPLKIESNNGNDNIRLREIDERMGSIDSVRIPSNSSFTSLINLTQNYFDQRYVTMGIYNLSGEYDKYKTLRFNHLIPGGKKIEYPSPLKSNSIKIEILQASGREKMISDIFFTQTPNFKNIFEKLEYLVKYHSESKFYPQIYSQYIYYLSAQGDSAKLFSNVNYFLDNIASYEAILVFNYTSYYLRNKLNWDYSEIRKYFLSLKEKYTTGKVAECIEFKLASDQYYKRSNERMSGWK